MKPKIGFNKLFLICMGVSLFAPILIFGGIYKATAAPKKVTLSLNLFVPPTHTRWTEGLKPWFEELEKRTEGRVEVRPYFASALSNFMEIYDSIIDGRADVGEVVLGMPAGRWPLIELINGSSMTHPTMLCKKPGAVLNTLYDEFPSLQEKFKKTKILFFHNSAPGAFATTKKLPKGLRDVKGLKMGVLNKPTSKKVRAIGMTPVFLPPMEVYTGLQKGVIDGNTATFEILVARRWGDHLKHHVINVPLGRVAFCVAMNKNVWNRLPIDVQKIIDEMNQDATQMMDDYWWNADISASKVYKEKYGGTIYRWSSKEVAKVEELIKPITDKWISDMEAEGLPAREIVTRYNELEKQYAVEFPY